MGWVRFFHDNLYYVLRQRLGQNIRIWFDAIDLEPSDMVGIVEERIQETRVFIPVLSHNYLSSPWCRRELETFINLHPDLDSSDSSSGIFAVYKHAILERDLLPVALQNRLGYSFFEDDRESGIERPYFMTGLLVAKHENSYFDLINKLAQQIARHLRELPAPAEE